MSHEDVPALDSLAGEWMTRAELAHLPSLRNQWGQAHVDEDLASISWLAFAPYSVGYHTGALRVDGRVVTAERYQWSAWGVRRGASVGDVEVQSDVRLGFEETSVFWRHTVTNMSDQPVRVVVEQELLCMVARSEVDWGWLYGNPWNSGHHHDFYATERIRSEVVADEPRQVQLLMPDARFVRLGRSRVPGIQRDEVSAPMLLESELPDHSTRDTGRVRKPGINGRVRDIRFVAESGETVAIGDSDENVLSPMSENRLSPVSLAEFPELRLSLLLSDPDQTGVVLTHGNHPDSLQLSLESGRLALSIGGERVLDAASFPVGVWTDVAVTVDAERARLLVNGVVVASTEPWWGGQRWTAAYGDGRIVTISDAESSARAAYGFEVAPDGIRIDGARAFAVWELSVEPGSTVALGIALAIGDDAGEVERRVRRTASAFAERFAAIADRWRSLWVDAFTPGNASFSGHLPVLVTSDAELARTYYLGALLALYLRNSKVSSIGPVFLTGGPRLGATTTYYWDQSEWARTAAMLEPVGLRAWILAALAQPYEASHSFDTFKLLPVGNHYAANDHALFRIVESYAAVTGDLAVLDESVRGMSVLDHLRTMAYRPRTNPSRFGSRVLVDFGRDAWELLECVPNYRDAVVSLNAGYVGIMRSLAAVLRLRGEREEADNAESDASRLADAVLGQYAGSGQWFIAHPEGGERIGHCLDFELVAASMAEDLTVEQRHEMVEFVAEHLIDGDWMRALSPADPIAPLSDRPDHGAAGAFAAWPGATAFGLCRLDRPDLALGVLRRAHRATSGALWGQAMEHVADGKYRVAERGVSNRDSNAAVAVTEAVIAGLFGIRADFGALVDPQGSLESEIGLLRNVRAVGFDLPVPEFAEALDPEPS